MADMKPDTDEAAEKRRATAWISHGLEKLVQDEPDIENPSSWVGNRIHFDVVIVGSGYGGAIAASELAGLDAGSSKPLSVCVLERGNEYLRGMFPSRLADLAGHVRFATPQDADARGVRDGLFDVRVGDDACALVANGLGGGSLINAGVMLMPHESVFKEARWPQDIREDATLKGIGSELQERLGARFPDQDPAKFSALRKLGAAEQIRVTVARRRGRNCADALLNACKNCGDCATGCNHNAKDSLDLNLLRVAQAAGAQIYTGATVLKLERCVNASGWALHLNHTDAHLRRRQKQAFVLRASKVILAAGTFGSTEILMRSQTDQLKFSELLGKNFSVNGDMIAVVHDTNTRINNIADETCGPDKRHVGPTISGMIDLRRGNPMTDLVIQDLAIPGPMRRLFEETVICADVLQRVVVPDCREHAPDIDVDDDAAVNRKAFRNGLAVAMIGRDAADGVLELRQCSAEQGKAQGDGVLTVKWPKLRDDPRFVKHHETLERLLADSGLGGRVITNPMWRPLSSTKLESIFGAQRGPLMTVHPLGGCPMGDDVRTGVVDHCGRVFNGVAPKPKNDFHEGLYVLDGAVVPTSLGINPALTISVLAQRAINRLKDTGEWPWAPLKTTLASRVKRPPSRLRPIFATPSVEQPVRTKIEITEQMRGMVHLEGDDLVSRGHCVELTLTFEPKALGELMACRQGRRELRVRPKNGQLRIFKVRPDPRTDEPEASDIELAADVSGTLRIFHFERSSPLGRGLRALWAWGWNRGLRDTAQRLVQGLRQRLSMEPTDSAGAPRWWHYFVDICRLATRAGAVRMLEYRLTIGKVTQSNGAGLFADQQFEGKTIRGIKRLTYARKGNPWHQLQDLALLDFPQTERWWTPASLVNSLTLTLADWRAARARYLRPPVLTLNLDFLAKKGVPLLRVLRQQDRPAALVDLLSFALYMGRILLQTHALSFRKPDPPTAREPVRLPGHVDRLPPPQIDWLTVGQTDTGQPIQIRLARYRDTDAVDALNTRQWPPVLLIHGYSASGTTFAHAEVKGNLAETLCRAGRDVWILDMRSSAGMPTATMDWAFEDMAASDIPRAIEHIRRVVRTDASQGDVQVDVVAHCMGSAMFSMALLDPRSDLHKRIGRVVLSQIGPVLMLTKENTFRAYVMRYVQHFLPLEDYTFRVDGAKPSLTNQLLDRALATLPYPRDEFVLENPIWPPGKATPWAGTRHRMDALYSHTFKLANLSSGVLDHIDDLFGPLSVKTVSQVIHFALSRTITDKTGFNRFVVPKRLQDRFTFPILSIHGEENGLASVATLDLMRDTLHNAGIPHINPTREHLRSWRHARQVIAAKPPRLAADAPCFMSWAVAGHGHQDCLIGKRAGDVSRVITSFLSR